MTREEQWLLEEKYQGKADAAFVADCERLQQGEPLAYLIGQVTFLGVQVDLSSRPLIPRVETEFLTERLAKEIGERPLSVLDLFAGSGCIGLGLLRQCSRVSVVFGELESRHCKGIARSAQCNQISEKRFQVYQSDVWSNIPTAQFDVIVANPPYLSRSRLDQIQSSVLAHEPPEALFAEADGLALIEAFLKGARPYLKAQGVLLVECDPWQIAAVSELGEKAGLVVSGSWLDQYQQERWVRFARS